MPITATCTSCGRNFFAPTQFAGKRVKCKGCGEIFTVPGLSEVTDLTDSDTVPDPLTELASIATGELVAGPQSNRAGEADENQSDDPESQDPTRGAKSSLTPNVLTFNYPGADDVDRWLPVALIVLGFLFLLSGPSNQDSGGTGWISFTRFLVPSLLYSAFTFPITLTMLKKAADEQRYAMPPNVKLRCFATYMPAFVLMTWAQFAGEGFTIVQLFAGILGLGISSALLWMFFRLREEHIGTTVAYGAGGFAAGALICGALLLGLNKIGALVVTSEHVVASVPVSPFGSGFSWPSPPAAAPLRAVASAPKTQSEPSTMTAAAAPSPAPSTPSAVMTESTAIGHFDVSAIPGIIGDVIDPLNDSPFVCVLRGKQNGVAIECWNTQTWERLPGTLQLPNRPSGNIAISTDGQRMAWIAEFPRLSVQVWSFTSSAVVSTVDLDRSQGGATLIGFVGENLLLIDGMSPQAPQPVQIAVTPAPVDIAKPAPPAAPVNVAPAKPHNIFDMDAATPPQPRDNSVVWASGTHGNQVRPAEPAPVQPDPNAHVDPNAGVPVKPVPVAPPAPPAAAPPASGDQPGEHLLSIVDVTTGATVRSFSLPMLAAEPNAVRGSADAIRYGENLTISVGSQRLAAACKIDGIPSLLQIDLNTGKSRQTIKVSEIDPELSACPTGLAYSNDGQNLAALFENGGSALLLAYESSSGRRISKFVYPAGPLEGAPHWLFRGSAICWLDPSPYWLVYGQGIVSTQSGAHIKSADLNLSDTGQQRTLDGDRVELLTNTTAGKKLLILQLDRSKLNISPDN